MGPFPPLFPVLEQGRFNDFHKDGMRMKRGVIGMALLAGAVVAGFSLTAVAAPGKAKDEAAIPKIGSADGKAWANRCDEMKDKDGKVAGKYCEAFQRLSVVAGEGEKKQMQRVAEFAIGYPPADKGKAGAVFILPLGVIVDGDIKVQIDEKDVMKFRVRYCDNGGCAAILKLDNSIIDKMKKGKVMTVKAQSLGGPFDVPFRLDGFGPALEAVKPKA